MIAKRHRPFFSFMVVLILCCCSAVLHPAAAGHAGYAQPGLTEDDILLELVMFVGVVCDDTTAPQLVQTGLVRPLLCLQGSPPPHILSRGRHIASLVAGFVSLAKQRSRKFADSALQFTAVLFWFCSVAIGESLCMKLQDM